MRWRCQLVRAKGFVAELRQRLRRAPRQAEGIQELPRPGKLCASDLADRHLGLSHLGAIAWQVWAHQALCPARRRCLVEELLPKSGFEGRHALVERAFAVRAL